MTRPLLLFVATLVVAQVSIMQAQTTRFAYQKFPADTVKNVIDDLTKELSIKHPGFTGTAESYYAARELRGFTEGLNLHKQ